jgi:hypothetical protein
VPQGALACTSTHLVDDRDHAAPVTRAYGADQSPAHYLLSSRVGNRRVRQVTGPGHVRCVEQCPGRPQSTSTAWLHDLDGWLYGTHRLRDPFGRWWHRRVSRAAAEALFQVGQIRLEYRHLSRSSSFSDAACSYEGASGEGSRVGIPHGTRGVPPHGGSGGQRVDRPQASDEYGS